MRRVTHIGDIQSADIHTSSEHPTRNEEETGMRSSLQSQAKQQPSPSLRLVDGISASLARD
jgi:hypothetical protein